MNKEVQRFFVTVLALSMFSNGCVPTRRFYFFKHEDMANYRQVAAEIETPGEPVCREPTRLSGPPITPDTFEDTPLRDMSLQEALGIRPTPGDHRQDFVDLCGVWSKADVQAFSRVIQDLESIHPDDWS